MHFSNFSSSHSPTGLQMRNLALIPKQQEFKCPSSLTQKITFQGQTAFHSFQTRTEKDREESQFSRMPLFHTRQLHFYKHNSGIVGHQRQDRNVQQSNRDTVITYEKHHGQSSSALLVCNWSCKINKDHIARAIILSSSQTNNRPQLLHSPEPGDPGRGTKT